MKFFNLHHSETQFLANVANFGGPENSQAPFSGRASDVKSKKNRCIKVRKTGVVRTLKYKGPQKTGVVCGPYIIKVHIEVYGV